MGFDRPQGFVGNITHKEAANDHICHKRANQRPVQSQIVHNTHLDDASLGVQKPCDFHAATDAAYMGKVNLVPERVKTLTRHPPYRETVAAGSHFDHTVFWSLTGEYVHPSIMREEAWPLFDSTGHGKNLLNTSTDSNAILSVQRLPS
jgi:hypothetical protein